MPLSNTDRTYLENYKKHVVYKCPKCKGKNSFCDCWRNFNYELSKATANIPIKYRRYTLADFTHPQLKKQKETVTNYINSIEDMRFHGTSLYLYGDKGTAKTMSAILILMAALQHIYKCRYFESFRACIEFLKEEWGDDLKEGTDTLKQVLSDYDFIVIDNVGSEVLPNNSTTTGLVKNLLIHRSNSLLPTIFVSPVAAEKLTDANERAIVEMFADGLHLNFKGFDYQKEIQSKRTIL